MIKVLKCCSLHLVFCRFDFLCMPLFHPRFRREFESEPQRHRSGAQTRSDLLLSGRGLCSITIITSICTFCILPLCQTPLMIKLECCWSQSPGCSSASVAYGINEQMCFPNSRLNGDWMSVLTLRIRHFIFIVLCPDWNTLIVGKLSSWIEADSEIENVRRNSEAVSPSSQKPRSMISFLKSSCALLTPYLCLSPGSGTGVELLSLFGAARVPDPPNWS